MKTTIKLTQQMFESVTVKPRGDMVVIEAGPAPTKSGTVVLVLSQDQVGAMLFGMEQAAEASGISRGMLFGMEQAA